MVSLISRFVTAQSVRSGTRRYRSEVITDRAGFAALERDWKALEAAGGARTVFQSYDWCAQWLESCAFQPDAAYRTRILTVRDMAGQLCMVFPLCSHRRGPVTCAEWIGQPIIQYGDILLDPDADLQAIRASLARADAGWHGINTILLRKVRDDSHVAHLIVLERYRVGERDEAGIADLSAFADFEAYHRTHAAASRKSRRSKRRRLEATGPVTFDVVAPGPEARALCDKAIDWKVGWLEAVNQSSRMFALPQALDALRTMAGNAERDTGFRVYAVRCGGEPVAVECSFVHEKTIYAFLGAYDPNFDRFSVGKLQIEDTVRHAFDAEMAAYDLLAPVTPYKESWSTARVGVADYFTPLDLAGNLYVNGYVRGLRPLAKKVYCSLPEPLRNRLVRLLM